MSAEKRICRDQEGTSSSWRAMNQKKATNGKVALV